MLNVDEYPPWLEQCENFSVYLSLTAIGLVMN